MMQTAVPDALQALMVLAQQANPVTPSGQPTVAAQLAQASAPQGMPQAMEDFEAAAPSVMRNMQQEQMAQMMRQASQQRPAGIEGLPAPNMRFAEGGVIGFAGPDGSEVPEAETPFGRLFKRRSTGIAEQEERARLRRQLEQQYGKASSLPGLFMAQTDAQRERAKEIMRMLPNMSAEQMRNLLGQVPAREVAPAAWEAAGPGEGAVMPEGVPERMRDTRAIPMPAAPSARPAGGPPRPAGGPAAAAAAAQPPNAAVPPGGIAQALPAKPTINDALTQVEQIMPGSGTEDSRIALMRLQQMRQQRPESGLATLKALEEEKRTQEAIAQELEGSRQKRALRAWLEGGSRLGGSGRSVAGFEEKERQRRMLFAQENTIRVSKMDAIREANEARRVGDQEKYVEALNKLAELDRADKQIKAQLAAQVLTSGIAARGQDITATTAEREVAARAAEGAANRATQLQIARIQAAARERPDSPEALAVARVQAAINGSPLLKALAEKSKFDPNAAKQYAIEEERLYLQLAPELLIGKGAASSGQSSTRSAADAILQGNR